MWWWPILEREAEAMVACMELCAHTAAMDYDKVIRPARWDLSSLALF